MFPGTLERRARHLIAVMWPNAVSAASNIARLRGNNMTKKIRLTGRLAPSLLIVAFASMSMLAAVYTHAQEARAHYYRIQLKHDGQYLDAGHCGTTVALNAGSTFANGACQLWRLVDAGNGGNDCS